MPPLFLRKSAGVSRRVLTRQECVLFILSRAFQVSFGEAGEGYPVAIHACRARHIIFEALREAMLPAKCQVQCPAIASVPNEQTLSGLRPIPHGAFPSVPPPRPRFTRVAYPYASPATPAPPALRAPPPSPPGAGQCVATKPYPVLLRDLPVEWTVGISPWGEGAGEGVSPFPGKMSPKTLMRPRSATGATDENPRRVITAGTSRLEARQPGLRFRFRWDFHVKVPLRPPTPPGLLPRPLPGARAVMAIPGGEPGPGAALTPVSLRGQMRFRR